MPREENYDMKIMFWCFTCYNRMFTIFSVYLSSLLDTFRKLINVCVYIIKRDIHFVFVLYILN